MSGIAGEIALLAEGFPQPVQHGFNGPGKGSQFFGHGRLGRRPKLPIEHGYRSRLAGQFSQRLEPSAHAPGGHCADDKKQKQADACNRKAQFRELLTHAHQGRGVNHCDSLRHADIFFAIEHRHLPQNNGSVRNAVHGKIGECAAWIQFQRS